MHANKYACMYVCKYIDTRAFVRACMLAPFCECVYRSRAPIIIQTDCLGLVFRCILLIVVCKCAIISYIRGSCRESPIQLHTASGDTGHRRLKDLVLLRSLSVVSAV